MVRHIKKSDLKIVFNRIIKRLEDEGLASIEIESDLYNIIPADKWDIINKIEDVVIIGSLQDDIDCIKQLAKDTTRFCTYVDFDRVATILRAISQKQCPANDDSHSNTPH